VLVEQAMEAGMAKRVAIDESRLKAAAQAISERKRPDVNRARLSQHSQIMNPAQSGKTTPAAVC
jgi:hypothetical protein